MFIYSTEKINSFRLKKANAPLPPYPFFDKSIPSYAFNIICIIMLRKLHKTRINKKYTDYWNGNNYWYIHHSGKQTKSQITYQKVPFHVNLNAVWLIKFHTVLKDRVGFKNGNKKWIFKSSEKFPDEICYRRKMFPLLLQPSPNLS